MATSTDADETTTSTCSNSTEAPMIEGPKQKEFAVGDHVFCWCSYQGLPFAYQQHGVVVELQDSSMVIMNFDYEEEESHKEKVNGGTRMDQQDQTFILENETEEDASHPNGNRDSPTTNATQTVNILVDSKDEPEKMEDLQPEKEADLQLCDPNGNREEDALETSNNNSETTHSTADPKKDDGCQAEQKRDEPAKEEPEPAQRFHFNFWKKREPEPRQDETTITVDHDPSPPELPPQRFQFWKKETKPQPEKDKETTGICSTEHKNQPNIQQNIANFFQRKSNSNKELETIHPRESVFASAPERPCTLTRQVISNPQAQEKWEHVQYGQQWNKRLVSRAGTCSPLQPHPLPVVLLRIQFLQQHPDLLSAISYHHQKANGECIASWCKAGQYRSFQGTAKQGMPGLHAATFGMAAEYGAIAGGQVAASILFPPCIPFLAAYDLYDVYYYGSTFHKVHNTDKEWKERTQVWNEAFSKYLHENKDTVERIQESLLLSQANKDDQTVEEVEVVQAQEAFPLVEEEASKEEAPVAAVAS